MRLLTMSQPDTLFTAVGARPYHAMPSKTDVPQLAALHAASEPTAWAELERRADGDKHLRHCLCSFGIMSGADFAELACGAIIAIVRVVEVLDARQYNDPPLTTIGGKPYLWRLEPVRIIKPIPVRARPNFWGMPDELAEQVLAAETDDSIDVEIPPGIGRTVFPRRHWRWEREVGLGPEERVWLRHLDIHWKRRDPLYWNLEDGAAEQQLRRRIARYIKTHETRGDPPAREVKVDRRIRLFRRLFPDVTWATLHEFERRVRADAVEREQAAMDAAEDEVDDAGEALVAAREALVAAREELARREHEYRMLTDDSYAGRLDQEAEQERKDAKRQHREETRHEKDSWQKDLREDTARRAREKEARGGD